MHVSKLLLNRFPGYYSLLVGAHGRCPPWSPLWVPVTLGHRALLYILFFLIFYSLFGPCPARPFIFSYLLPLIWPLPCAPFYFSLSFTFYLAPAPRAHLFFPYLLFFIWPLPCPPFYFSLSFILYLTPTLPALLFFLIFYSLFGSYPSRTALPPAPPSPVWPPVFLTLGTRFPNPVFRIRLSGPNLVFQIRLSGPVPRVHWNTEPLSDA